MRCETAQPQWRNGQRIRLLIWGLRVRVPPGVVFAHGRVYTARAVCRRYGATVAREIPDLKVGGSNPSSVKMVFLRKKAL